MFGSNPRDKSLACQTFFLKDSSSCRNAWGIQDLTQPSRIKFYMHTTPCSPYQSYEINHVDFSSRFKTIRKEKDLHLGEYFLMKDKESKRRVIVKARNFQDQDELQSTIQGVNALLVLSQCPSIVKFIGYSVKGKTISLIYENHENTLEESLKGVHSRIFTDKSLMTFMVNMVEGLAFLQTLDLNYMDFKTSNVLQQNRDSLNNCFKVFFTHYITNSVSQIKQLEVPIENYFLSSFQLDELNLDNVQLTFQDKVHSDIQSLGLMALWLGTPNIKDKYYQYNEEDQLEINQDIIAKRMKQFRKIYTKRTVKLLQILLSGQEDTFNNILAITGDSSNKAKKHPTTLEQDQEESKSSQRFGRSDHRKSNQKSFHNTSYQPQAQPQSQSVSQIDQSLRRKTYLSSLEQIQNKIIYQPKTKQLFPSMQKKQYADGSYFVGELSESHMREGKGIYYYSEGDVYAGDWVDNALQGYGIYLFSNGEKYQGTVQKGIKVGKGEYIYSNYNRYDGEWANDKKHGFGVYTYHVKGEKYEGDFKNGFKQGRGLFIFQNGDRFEGSFTRGEKNGSGIGLYRNRDKLTGTWEAGEFNGKGAIQYTNGDKSTSEFVKGKKQGRGCYTYKNLTRFEGQYSNNIKRGACVIKYNNGDSYEGDLEDGRRHGFGTYYYSNGSNYTGQWRCNCKEGAGVFRLQNSLIVSGNWNSKGIQSPCKITYPNGDVYDGHTHQLIIKQGEGVYTFASGQRLQGQFAANAFVKGLYIDCTNNQTVV